MQVPILKAHLKGKWIGGQEWRAGNKKRSELISDYRCAHHIVCVPSQKQSGSEKYTITDLPNHFRIMITEL